MIELARVDPAAERWLPHIEPDGSGVGINYCDRVLKPLKKVLLPDGRKLKCSRRGLKIILKVGDRTGTGLLRRLDHGPDVRVMLREALRDAGLGAGVSLVLDAQAILLGELIAGDE